MKIKKTIIKILIILIEIVIVTNTLGIQNVSMADDSYDVTTLTDGDGFKPNDSQYSKIFNPIIGNVLGALSVIGTLLTVVIIAVMGFQYMTAGSSEQQADIKSKMGGLLIGVVFLTGAVSIVRIIMFAASY